MYNLKVRVLFILSGLFVSLGVLISSVGLLNFHKYSRFQIPEFNIFLENLRLHHLFELKAESIEINRAIHHKEIELTSSFYFLPNSKVLKPYLPILRAIESCQSLQEFKQEDLQIQKLKMWKAHHCDKSELDSSLWSEKPFNHPMGGSWAFWIWKKKSFSQQWLDDQKQNLHILEYQHLSPEILTQEEKFFSGLSPDSWQALNLGLPSYVAPPFIYFKGHHAMGQISYQRYKLKSVQSKLSNSPYVIATSADAECLVELGEFCWVVSPRYTPSHYNLWAYLSVLGLLIVVLSLVYLLWRLRKDYDSQRDLMVHTLAHELRHPATSINMSLEFFRNNIDKFDEDLQVEVLRMVDEVKRLKLLVRASEQYLVTDSQKKIRFKTINVQSVNSYLNRIATSYDIIFEALSEDISFRCDAYWLGVCIENLIKNGLRHGERPVTLSATYQDEVLKISIIDSGKGIDGDFKENLNPFTKSKESLGIGLGLAITLKVVNLMGAELNYSRRPSKFTLNIKQSKRRGYVDNSAA